MSPDKGAETGARHFRKDPVLLVDRWLLVTPRHLEHHQIGPLWSEMDPLAAPFTKPQNGLFRTLRNPKWTTSRYQKVRHIDTKCSSIHKSLSSMRMDPASGAKQDTEPPDSGDFFFTGARTVAGAVRNKVVSSPQQVQINQN